MPHVITEPTRIPVPGGKLIDEFVGNVATGTAGVSVARMEAPPGWSEPAQAPEFDEVTLVLHGSVFVESFAGDGATVEVRAGQAVLTRAGEKVRYSVGPDGADYVAICLPAFAPDLAHRDDEADAEPDDEADAEPDAEPVAEAAGDTAEAAAGEQAPATTG